MAANRKTFSIGYTNNRVKFLKIVQFYGYIVKNTHAEIKQRPTTEQAFTPDIMQVTYEETVLFIRQLQFHNYVNLQILCLLFFEGFYYDLKSTNCTAPCDETKLYLSPAFRD